MEAGTSRGYVSLRRLRAGDRSVRRPTVSEIRMKWTKCLPCGGQARCHSCRDVAALTSRTRTERLRSASSAPRRPRDRPLKAEFARSESISPLNTPAFRSLSFIFIHFFC
ncbi:hypothetical protein Q8A73_014138 [Channa argus]|nr:hypothetical protein Q8A73_014138 [Channa argus]